MNIVVLHNAVAADAAAAERDVLTQVAAVSGALRALGHSPTPLPVTLDLAALENRLTTERPAAVVNLIETLGATDRLAPAAAVLLETLGIPFTGSGADALYLAGSKRLTKERLVAASLPTPAAAYPYGKRVELVGDDSTMLLPNRFLLKSLHEHASFAIDDSAVISASTVVDLGRNLHERSVTYGKPFFAERFIEGREFNMSVLDHGDGTPEVLSAAEIVFEDFPSNKPRIVGHAAKWDDSSFEYRQTPRRFDFPPADRELIGRLTQFAAAAWVALRLRGYARIDFRVDEAGEPWIIEANANPCLSPDAGFAAALNRSAISFPKAVERILLAAVE